MKKRILSIVLSLLLLFSLVACGDSATSSDSTNEDSSSAGSADNTYTYDGENPIVTIEMENGGIIKLELYPEIAPITVANFVSLAESGFYDGLIFHRVISGFMIQGGDPLGTGMGGSDEKIVGEFSANGYENDLSHTRGVISMARSSAYDSASSQFFIMHADYPYLDGSYAAFGMVIEGMDIVDEIAAVDVNSSDKPFEDQVIKSITVD